MTTMKRKKTTRRARRPDKRDEILSIATEYFLAHGYDGASINEMARESGISKESIYRYFRSKKRLFEAVIDRELEGYHRRLRSIAQERPGSLRAQLLVVAKTLLSVVTTSRTLAMRRLIFQQASHNKDVGRHYFQIGPRHAYKQLASLFTAHATRSALSPEQLSRYFVAIVLHFPLLQRECAIRPPMKSAQVSEVATRAVDDFMRAFLRNNGRG
jgi:AcrR family transcriptional regulator